MPVTSGKSGHLRSSYHLTVEANTYTHYAHVPPVGRRGIDVVRNKIKSFAQRKVTLPAGRHKIIILDEADS